MLIFSDVHFGLKNDDPERLNDAEQCIDWIISVGKERNERVCVFAGDWFNDRGSIGVNTLAVAKRNVEKLCKAFKLVIMIAGNHDNFYNHNNSLSSLEIFNGIAPNLQVVISAPLVLNNCEGMKICFAPWLYDPNAETTKYDVLIGHFEFIGGKMNGRTSGGKYGIRSLLAVAPLVFTGHYHLTATYDREEGKIVSLGSPYQIDWSDCGDRKRIVLLSKDGFESIENTVSPQFYKLPASKLSSLSEDKLRTFFSNPNLQKSSIQLTVAESVDQDALTRILTIGRAGALRSLEFAYSVGNGELIEKAAEEMKATEGKPVETYVHEFIDVMLKDERFASIDGKKVHELAEHYFAKVRGE